MVLARPVDAHKPLDFCCHDHTSSRIRTDRDDRQSLYWRSKRNLLPDFRRGRPAGVRVLARCSKHRENWAALGGPARPNQSKADGFTTGLRVQGEEQRRGETIPALPCTRGLDR